MEETLVNFFGPLDTVLGPYIEYVLLALLLVNIAGRALEYGRIKRQAADGADAVTRHPVRVGTNFLLVVGAFYYMTLHHHGGMVFSILMLGVFITDLFEFESRKVEVRREIDIERPKGAIAASFLALLYIGYQTLFFLIQPFWASVV